MTAVECEVRLTAHRSAGRLHTADQSARLGTAHLLAASVTINGHQVRTTLHRMAGGYSMAVNAELRHLLGVQAGDKHCWIGLPRSPDGWSG